MRTPNEIEFVFGMPHTEAEGANASRAAPIRGAHKRTHKMPLNQVKFLFFFCCFATQNANVLTTTVAQRPMCVCVCRTCCMAHDKHSTQINSTRRDKSKMSK